MLENDLHIALAKRQQQNNYYNLCWNSKIPCTTLSRRATKFLSQSSPKYFLLPTNSCHPRHLLRGYFFILFFSAGLQWNTTKLEGIVMIDSSAPEIKLVVATVHDTTILLSCCAICGHCHQQIVMGHGRRHFSIHLGTTEEGIKDKCSIFVIHVEKDDGLSYDYV